MCIPNLQCHPAHPVKHYNKNKIRQNMEMECTKLKCLLSVSLFQIFRHLSKPKDDGYCSEFALCVPPKQSFVVLFGTMGCPIW